MDWTTWSALGRTYAYKPATQALAAIEHVNWEYYEMSALSNMTGTPGSAFDGDVVNLTHKPADYSMGFQTGLAANEKDNDYGMAGWFGWYGTLGGASYTDWGDMNADLSCSYTNCYDTSIPVAISTLLEGPFDPATGMMNDALREAGVLPMTEPYSAMGFVPVGSNAGGETITATVLATTGQNAIVDWVWVELRDANDSTSVVAARAGLLQRDGDVVDTDGTSALRFEGLAVGNYYLAIFHRNHLGGHDRCAYPAFSCDSGCGLHRSGYPNLWLQQPEDCNGRRMRALCRRCQCQRTGAEYR